MLRRAPSSWTTGSIAVQPLVLVVGEDERARRALTSLLAMNGFRSLRMGVGLGADPADLRRALDHQPDIVLLEAGVSRIDRDRVARALREDRSATPLIALAASDDTGTELVRRLRAQLKPRRVGADGSPPRGAHERLLPGRDGHSLLVDGHEVHVTPLEGRLVAVLLRACAQPLSEEQIIRAVWGPASVVNAQSLRALVRQLRFKIERDPARPRRLVRSRAGGYRLKVT